MNKWEVAIEKFLESYIKKEYFLGAILTGSYATGNNDENSDIDIYIITTDDTKWRERGNKNIDGFLIEYFINPKRKIFSYMEQELQTYCLSTTMIFVNAKILYDKNCSVQELIDVAKSNANLNNFADIDDFKFKMNCYGVWDSFDELESKYKKHEDIDFSYYIFIQKVLESYFYNKRIPSIPLNKIKKILKKDNFRNRYNVKKLPDQEFILKIINCFEEKNYDKKFNYARDLYNYFFSQFTNFDINNLIIRSSAE